MSEFTLNVWHDKTSDRLIPDGRHHLGGTDTLQIAAFTHLFPEGYCYYVFRDQVYELAELHGWEVRITTNHELHPS